MCLSVNFASHYEKALQHDGMSSKKEFTLCRTSPTPHRPPTPTGPPIPTEKGDKNEKNENGSVASLESVPDCCCLISGD